MWEPKHADGRQRVLVNDGLYVRTYPDGQLWCAALVHKGCYAGWLSRRVQDLKARRRRRRD